MDRNTSESAPPRFQPGDKVRVRAGVPDPEFPDIPIGGWTGIVTKIEQDNDLINYEIRWDERTHDAMHPVFRKRCERDELEVETLWLTEVDLEPDNGTPVPVDQPTAIQTPPLSERDQDDRVRKVFGLTHDDPLPEIGPETLLAYHRDLAANLKFPFRAYRGEEEVGPYSRKRATLTVTGLLDPEPEGHGLEDGLVCVGHFREGAIEVPLAEIEVAKKDPNSQPISDYASWFSNAPWQDESDHETVDDPLSLEPPVRPPGSRSFPRVVVFCGVAAVFVGATVGAALWTIPGAGVAALIGAVPLGMIAALLLGRFGQIIGAVYRERFGGLTGALLGLLSGGLVGASAALTIVALPWSLVGLIAGLFVGPYVIPRTPRRPISLRGAFLGAACGVLFSAFRRDPAGAALGAVTGLLAVAGLLLFVIAVSYLARKAALRHYITDAAEDLVQQDDDRKGQLRLSRS